MKINFQNKTNDKNIILQKKKIISFLQLILYKKCEITICFVNFYEIKKINFIYRNINYPTNILAFPYDIPKYTNSSLIGDLIICPEIIKKESIVQKKKIETHLIHIMIHGTLHLLGYHHKNNKQLNIMKKIEINIMKKLGYQNPYIF